MNLNLLKNKKIAILGLGLENLALVKFILKNNIKCEITVCDRRVEIKSKLPVFWQLGKGYNKNLNKFDILFRSPGWPMDCPGIKIAKKKGTQIFSPMKLFFELCPTKNIIGVTGTKGKGTTASLIYKILKKGFERAATNGAHTNEKIKKRVWLGGNIGVAPFEFMDKIRKNDWVVLELSSFQLEDMTVSPRIAVITNFYSEHLAPADPNNPNYHKSLKEYWEAKMNIVKWQRKGDWAITNYELRITNYELNTKAKVIYFKKSELPSRLIGEHNKENIAAAVAVAKIVGVKQEIINQAVADFKGLEHRLELVREYQGVKYYNDSFATTPEATIIALNSFNEPLAVLLGGADKKSDFKQLAKEVKSKVRFVALLDGQATGKIKKELLSVGYPKSRMKLVYSLTEAIDLARGKLRAGGAILLSTGCASFGMFKNYKERGDLFKKEVKGLPRQIIFPLAKLAHSAI
jgi:UDP-N-acetylmuramoylalanine--D-glutamate ligase